MSYIKKRAETFAKERIAYDVHNFEAIISDAKGELYNIDDKLDQSLFLQIVLAENELQYQKHLPACKQPETCQKNYAYESISYFLNQELNRIGLRSNEDQFTSEDKRLAEDKMDKVLQEIQKLRGEQSEEFKKVRQEFEELKELYLLGKKKWYQLFIGKSLEMVVSGVISETVSKGIVLALGGA